MPEHIHDVTGATNLYAVIANAAGQRWNGSAFESLVVANWDSYDIGLTENPAGSYRYVFSVPAEINYPTILTVHVYEKRGGTPAASDTHLDSGDINWNGHAIVDLPADWESTPEFLVPHTIKGDDGKPIDSCEVVITRTNTSSSNDVIDSSYTNDGGKVEFKLNSGSYYLWRNKRRYRFDDPISFTVGSDGTVTYD